MSKKKEGWIKNIQIYIAIGGLAVGLITTFVKLSMSAEATKTKVDELSKDIKEIVKEENEELEKVKEENKKDVAELKEANAELDKAIVTQTIRLENIQQLLMNIDKKLEKKK